MRSIATVKLFIIILQPVAAMDYNNSNTNNVSSLSVVNNVSAIYALYTWEIKQNNIRNMG